MKTIFLLPLLLFSACTCAAAINIRGTVFDAERTPIEFVNVSAFANDRIVGGCVTDSLGRFSLIAPDECDKVRISCIGYADTIIAPTGDCLLCEIILRQLSTTLSEVVVKAPLIRREADRIILNVAANPLSANKDAHELLKTAPGVWATDNSLSIYGHGGTVVYIDDRKVNMSGTQLMTYLKSIQSSLIASIEIIPKSGAEFSASSSGGVIRINLKRNRVDGLSGSAGMSTTLGAYKAWLNPFANVSLHSGKWTVNLSGNMNGSPSDKHITHELSDNSGSYLTLAGLSRHKVKTLQGGLMLGVFYEPTGKDKIGLQIDYNPDRSNSTAASRTELSSELRDEITLGAYHSRYRFHNLNIALNYSHALDNNGSVLKWNSNYNYQYSSTVENNRMHWLPSRNDSIYTTETSNRYNIFDTEFSVRKNFMSGWKANVGLKYTHNDVLCDSRHYNYIDEEWTSNHVFDYENSYREDIAAAYMTLNAQAGRWHFKTGLRCEYYHTSGVEFGQSKFDLFPNVNVMYNLTEHGDYTMALGYYRNIRRPSFWALDPTVRQVSDYSYSVGNPYLRPSLVDAVSLDFVLSGKFTIAAGYSKTDDPIRQMFASDAEHPERMYLTWENIGSDRSGFIHGDGLINVARWWNLYAGLTYAITSQRLDRQSRYDTFGYLQATVSMTFILPHSLSITVNGFFQTRMKTGNIMIYPILNITPTVQKRIGTHWALSFGLENPLQRKGKIRVVSSGYNRLTFTRQHVAVKLGVTYNFNSGKGFRTPQIEKNNDGSRFKKE